MEIITIVIFIVAVVVEKFRIDLKILYHFRTETKIYIRLKKINEITLFQVNQISLNSREAENLANFLGYSNMLQTLWDWGSI